MALLFQDGFDNYNTLSQKYTVNGSPTIDPTGGRFLGGAFKITSNGQYIRTPVITAGDVFIVNFAFKATTLPTSATRPFDLAMFIDSTNAQVALRVYDTGVVKLERLSGSGFLDLTSQTVLATSSGAALVTGTWYAFEIKLLIANSGTCSVKQDGAAIITFTGDTQATASANANLVLFGIAQSSGGGTAFWDDIIVMDDAGSFMNDLIGDKRIYTLYPTADGNYSAWTPSSGSSHSALVDETPPNDDVDYVMADTVGNKDTYLMSDIPIGTTNIKAVCVVTRVRKDDAGTRIVKAKLRSNGVDGNGSNVGLTSAYAFYSEPFYQDPDGSITWTAAKVNAVEAGQEVVT